MPSPSWEKKFSTVIASVCTWAAVARGALGWTGLTWLCARFPVDQAGHRPRAWSTVRLDADRRAPWQANADGASAASAPVIASALVSPSFVRNRRLSCSGIGLWPIADLSIVALPGLAVGLARSESRYTFYSAIRPWDLGSPGRRLQWMTAVKQVYEARKFSMPVGRRSHLRTEGGAVNSVLPTRGGAVW